MYHLKITPPPLSISPITPVAARAPNYRPGNSICSICSICSWAYEGPSYGSMARQTRGKRQSGHLHPYSMYNITTMLLYVWHHYHLTLCMASLPSDCWQDAGLSLAGSSHGGTSTGQSAMAAGSISWPMELLTALCSGKISQMDGYWGEESSCNIKPDWISFIKNTI